MIRRDFSIYGLRSSSRSSSVSGLLVPTIHCSNYVDHYMKIVASVSEWRTAPLPATSLSRVYLLTNGWSEWLVELNQALQADRRSSYVDEWAPIEISRDLCLTRGQQDNPEPTDMAVAQLADVFLGNLVRSLFVSHFFLFC